jgi:signal transduction histidine kinase
MRPLVTAVRHAPFDVHEREGLERIIASARLVVSVASLVATRFDQPAVPQFAGATDALLVAYSVYSLLVLLLVRFRPATLVYRGMAIEGIDLFWAAAITTVTGGPSSHFSPPLFVFALLVAAYRWGILETAVVGGASVVLLSADAVAAWAGYLGVPLHLSDLVLRLVWLVLVTFILGYLAEWNRGLRAESVVLARISRHVRVQAGLGASVRAVLAEAKEAFGAARALLVSEELSTSRAFAWSVGGTDAASRVSDRALELISAGRTDYLFQTPAYADTWGAVHGTARRALPAPRISGVDPDGRRVTADFALPDRVVGDQPWSSLMLTSTVVDDWRVRMILIDPRAAATSDTELRFLQTISRQVGPALVNLYLVRRLRMKVQDVERARMARELHDGVIQALVGLDLEMEVVRRQVGHPTGDVAATLQRLQEVVREQVAEVRALMRQVRPLRADGRTLVGTLKEIVTAFGRTGRLTTTFVSEVEEVDLPPYVCRELARIVGEALMNARKHSRATEAKVSLAPLDGGWQLLIDDNGRGFDFTGRLSHEEMAERHTGPAILTERVLEIGGRLWVQSMPGKGARLDIRVERRENL